MASAAELEVLAGCRGADLSELRDRSRVWIQAQHDGEAPGPRVVDLVERRLVVYLPAGAVTGR